MKKPFWNHLYSDSFGVANQDNKENHDLNIDQLNRHIDFDSGSKIPGMA